MERSPFSIRLIGLRKARNMTQADMADKLDIKNRSTYTCYETGTSSPNITMLCQIADVFNVSVDYLLGRVATPEATEGMGEPLDPIEEIQLVERYRLITEAQRRIVFDMMKEFTGK